MPRRFVVGSGRGPRLDLGHIFTVLPGIGPVVSNGLDMAASVAEGASSATGTLSGGVVTPSMSATVTQGASTTSATMPTQFLSGGPFRFYVAPGRGPRLDGGNFFTVMPGRGAIKSSGVALSAQVTEGPSSVQAAMGGGSSPGMAAVVAEGASSVKATLGSKPMFTIFPGRGLVFSKTSQFGVLPERGPTLLPQRPPDPPPGMAASTGQAASSASATMNNDPTLSDWAGLSAGRFNKNLLKRNLLNATLVGRFGLQKALTAAIAGSPIIVPPTPSLAFRGMGQNMRWTLQGFSGGSNWAAVYRSRHYSATAWTGRFRVVIPTGYSAQVAGLTDTPFPFSYKFQVGFDKTYVNSLTVPATDIQVTFGGSTTASYDKNSPPSTGYIVSDIMDAGQAFAGGQLFGLRTLVENADGVNSAVNCIPYIANSSNNSQAGLQRWQGSQTTATSQIAANGCFGAQTFHALSTGQGGISSWFTPCMLLLEQDASIPAWLGVGDSIMYGVGDGLHGNFSGTNINGSNQIGMAVAATASTVTLDAQASPVSGSYVNSVIAITGGTGSGQSALVTGYNATTRVLTISGAWTTPLDATSTYSIATGDSLGSALGNAGYCARWVYEGLHKNFVNFGRGSDGFKYANATNWQYRLQLWALGNFTHILSENIHNDIAGGHAGADLTALFTNGYAMLRAACPGALIYQACCTPDSANGIPASADNYASVAGQNAGAGWGGSGSTRGIFNAQVRSLSLGNDGFIDPNPAIEAGYIEGQPSTETSKWICNGQPFWSTNEGTHQSSNSMDFARAGMFVSPALAA